LQLKNVNRPLAREGAAFLAEFDRLRPMALVTLGSIGEAHERAVSAIQAQGGLTAAEQRAVTSFVRLARESGLTPSSGRDAIKVGALHVRLLSAPTSTESDRESDRALPMARRRTLLDQLRDAFEECLLDAYRRGRRPGRAIPREVFVPKLRSAVTRLRKDTPKVTKRAVAVELNLDVKTLTRYLADNGIAWPPG